MSDAPMAERPEDSIAEAVPRQNPLGAFALRAVLVIDRFALDALKPWLGSYTTIASDPKKVAIMRAAVSPKDSHPVSGAMSDDR